MCKKALKLVHEGFARVQKGLEVGSRGFARVQKGIEVSSRCFCTCTKGSLNDVKMVLYSEQFGLEVTSSRFCAVNN